MAVAALCCSHSPLMHLPATAPPAVAAEAGRGFARLRRWLAQFAPELVIQFGTDHLSGFSYRLMPAFCIGVTAESIGDFRLPAGPLPVPGDQAEALVVALRQAGLDVAVSYRMTVDHGFTQSLQTLFGGLERVPVIPVFIDCLFPPLPPYQRVRRLGEAVGRWAAQAERRVLFLASGGLSHDPPLPRLQDAPPELRNRLIEGVEHTEAYQRERIERLLEATRAFAGGQSTLRPLNPAWDRAFMALLQQGRIEVADGYRDDELQRRAGRGGHEVRTWLAAFAALAAAAGPYQAEIDYYRPVPEWFGGIGMMHAWPVAAATLNAGRAGVRE